MWTRSIDVHFEKVGHDVEILDWGQASRVSQGHVSRDEVIEVFGSDLLILRYAQELLSGQRRPCSALQIIAVADRAGLMEDSLSGRRLGLAIVALSRRGICQRRYTFR